MAFEVANQTTGEVVDEYEEMDAEVSLSGFALPVMLTKAGGKRICARRRDT